MVSLTFDFLNMWYTFSNPEMIKTMTQEDTNFVALLGTQLVEYGITHHTISWFPLKTKFGSLYGSNLRTNSDKIALQYWVFLFELLFTLREGHALHVRLDFN